MEKKNLKKLIEKGENERIEFREPQKTVASTTSSIFNYFEYSKYLFDNAVFILSVNSSTSSSVSCDFDTILWNRITLSNLDLSNLLTNIDQSIPSICLIELNSSGIFIFSSFMLNDNKYDYISFLVDDNEINFERIASIKQLEPQHVYDLTIENTRNFIANDIIAHNTYMGNTLFVNSTAGNLGIGTTTPSTLLDVRGVINASSLIYFNNGTAVGSGNISGAGNLNVIPILITNNTLGNSTIIFRISDLWFSNSSSANLGEYKSCSDSNNFLISEPFQKNENNLLVSNTNFIYIIPCDLSSLSLFCLASSPSSIASCSVNSLLSNFDSINSSNESLCKNFKAALLKIKDQSISGCASICDFKSLGNCNLNSSILINNGKDIFKLFGYVNKLETIIIREGRTQRLKIGDSFIYCQKGVDMLLGIDMIGVLKEFAVSEINNQILFSNNMSTNSSVVYTGTNNCFLRCGSLDQIAELVSNANAKKSISLESEIESLAFSRKSSYSLVLKNLIDFSTSICLISNSCLDNLDLSKHSSSCLLNSDLINSGAMNSAFIEENKYAETESGFIIENNELLSKINFILNYCKYSLFSLGESFENNLSLISGETSLSNCLNLSFFAFLPSSTDHLVSSCSSLDLSLSFNANNCMFFINCSRTLAKAILNSSLNSDGISTFTDISAITEINNNELYKSFGIEEVLLQMKYNVLAVLVNLSLANKSKKGIKIKVVFMRPKNVSENVPEKRKELILKLINKETNG